MTNSSEAKEMPPAAATAASAEKINIIHPAGETALCLNKLQHLGE